MDSVAHQRASERLLRNGGSIRNAFAGLGLGWTYEDVWEYLEGSPAFQAFGDQRGLAAGLVMGFALTAVERTGKAQVRAPVETTEGATMGDPLNPSASLLCKLGSIARHVEEGFSGAGHPLDLSTAGTLVEDTEVRAWMEQMEALALLPVKRDGDG